VTKIVSLTEIVANSLIVGEGCGARGLGDLCTGVDGEVLNGLIVRGGGCVCKWLILLRARGGMVFAV
jgi:hypothetical protein